MAIKYIVHKRFKHKAICGEVNLSAGTECECIEGLIEYNGKPLCYATSSSAHEFFARNDDGAGMLRGRLIRTIRATLERRDASYQSRWDKVWDDPVCQPYKRRERADFWLWNHDFYNADILTLRHIATLIGAKEDA